MEPVDGLHQPFVGHEHRLTPRCAVAFRAWGGGKLGAELRHARATAGSVGPQTSITSGRPESGSQRICDEPMLGAEVGRTFDRGQALRPAEQLPAVRVRAEPTRQITRPGPGWGEGIMARDPGCAVGVGKPARFQRPARERVRFAGEEGEQDMQSPS